METDVTRFRRGVELLKAGKLDEAIEELASAATTGEDLPIEHFALAVAYEKHGTNELAASEFERFLSMSPGDEKKVAYARAHLEKLRPRASKPVVATAVAVSESDASWNERGKAIFLKGIEEAIACFDKAWSLDRGRPEAPYNAALLALLIGDGQRARASLTELLSSHPSDAQAQDLLASIS